MAVLVWTMVGLAIWHFTIFLPDRFWAGIVGACVGAVTGAVLFGLLASGLSVPGREETNLLTALLAVPGSLIGIAVVWFIGARSEPEPA